MRLQKQYRPKGWVKIAGLVLLLLLVVWATSCGRVKKGSMEYTTEAGTAQRMFEAILLPMGNTMYVWGGGWDASDDKAGATATQLGVSEKWEAFAKKQDETYDFEEHLTKQDMGLDCSGYVGWVMYNTFSTADGQEGYVSQSTGMAQKLAERGWGCLIKNPRDFLPGDIVSMQGHVWICLGTCEDGSVLLVHSSPPGVSVCGTPAPQAMNAEKTESVAVRLARQFMTEHYAAWQEKYPKRMVPITYVEEVTLMRWNETVLEGIGEYQELSGEEMIEFLKGI